MQVSSLLFIFFLKVLHCFKFAIVPTVHFCLPRPHCCYCCSVVSDSLWPHGLQHARLPCPSHLPVCSNSCPFSQQWHPTISSSVIPSSCSQTFPASGSSPMSWLSLRMGAWVSVKEQISNQGDMMYFVWISEFCVTSGHQNHHLNSLPLVHGICK